MAEDETFDALIEERRKAWSAAASLLPAAGFLPVAEMFAADGSSADALGALEETMPLAKYRPERLM